MTEPLPIIRDAPLTGDAVESLREAAGWDRTTHSDAMLAGSYTHFSISEDDKLIAFVNVVSDGVGDAFLVNLLVHPDYQRRGLGRRFVKYAVDALTEDGIQCVWVTFDEQLDHLDRFYRLCGFDIQKAGVFDNAAPR